MDWDLQRHPGVHWCDCYKRSPIIAALLRFCLLSNGIPKTMRNDIASAAVRQRWHQLSLINQTLCVRSYILSVCPFIYQPVSPLPFPVVELGSNLCIVFTVSLFTSTASWLEGCRYVVVNRGYRLSSITLEGISTSSFPRPKTSASVRIQLGKPIVGSMGGRSRGRFEELYRSVDFLRIPKKSRNHVPRAREIRAITVTMSYHVADSKTICPQVSFREGCTLKLKDMMWWAVGRSFILILHSPIRSEVLLGCGITNGPGYFKLPTGT